MITRREVLAEAINKCIRELYSLAQPSVSYDDFIEENEKYTKKEKEYDSLPKENRPSYLEYMGPKPYEFYYLPKEVFKSIADSYVSAYRFNDKQEFLDNINILKQYCKEPIVDKYIEECTDEHGNYHPGYRGYDHPDNLEKEIEKILFGRMSEEPGEYREESAKILQNKFFEFLDMAGDFFNWTSYLNGFNTYVYLGGTPSSNKEAVIDNWKKYRNKDIEIDESIYNDKDD